MSEWNLSKSALFLPKLIAINFKYKNLFKITYFMLIKLINSIIMLLKIIFYLKYAT